MKTYFKKTITVFISIVLISAVFSGCNKNNAAKAGDINTSGKGSSDVSTDKMDFTFSDRDLDYSYNEDSSTKIDDSQDIVTISKAGTYIVSGTHSQIIVDASNDDKIQVVLKNATVLNSDSPAIYIKKADKVFITLADSSENTISDGNSYNLSDDESNVDGTIFSKADLTINGTGTLNVTGNYKSGIVSKDDLVITGGTLNITSTGSAINGKDCVKITAAKLNITSSGDGIKASNSEDENFGYIYIKDGNFNITAENDGLQAETVIKIDNGSFNINCGGGSANAASKSQAQGGFDRQGGFEKKDAAVSNTSSVSSTDETETEESKKGIKSGSLITVSGGSFNIDSSDDTLHSNSDTQIDSGEFILSSGDDGIHADNCLIINGGNISILKSYEGLEGKGITISGGEISLIASDDGINAADPNSTSSGFGQPGGNSGDVYISIKGGYILVNASGDGIDSNGSIAVSGGVLLVSGPTDDGNGAFDYDSSCVITGGTAILAGSSGMSQTFSDSSTQCSLMYTLDQSVNGGTPVAVTDDNGNVLASFTPAKNYINVIISTPSIKKESDYKLTVGGDISDADSNGYASEATVSNPEQTLDITISSVSTTYGTAGMGGGKGGMGDMGGRGQKPQGGQIPEGGNQPTPPTDGKQP